MTNGNDTAYLVIFETSYEPGLTKRELFAYGAMQGYISAGSNGMPDAEAIAGYAVAAADALISALNQSPQKQEP